MITRSNTQQGSGNQTMNSEWQKFLQSQGAEIGADGGVGFPSVEASGDCFLFDLSHLGLIAAEGPDTDTFLQGQLTNDLRELTEQHSQLSSHCNAKGRMLTNFRMIRRDGVIYLQPPAEGMALLLKRLGMYKLMSKVDLSDAGDRLIRIGLSGGCAKELLVAEIGETPELENGATRHGELTLIRLPGQTPRFEILGPVTRIIDLWTRLKVSGAISANPDLWSLLDIRAGVPTVYAATAEAFVPQMVNMQLVDGVSFTKGCYTGQEVVARMQYLGKLKRRMYRARVEATPCPQPGAAIFSGVSASGQGAGKVLDARTADDGHCELLAVVEIAAVKQGSVRLGEDGPELEFLELPYTFAEPES